MNTPTPLDVDRFRAAIARRLGLQFEEARYGVLADLLRRRAEEHREPYEPYLGRLESEAARAELAALAEELTVPETYFFRNLDQFRALTEEVLPERMRAQAGRRRLRLLSAGCASGDEAYSLAILAREATDPSWEVSILAVDVNPAVIEKAQRGRFSPWSLRETPPEVQRRWFQAAGREMILDDSLRAAVRFESRNLAEDDPELWPAGAYDVIFCRNVVMYFTPEQGRALVARLARSLVPGGYLFLGHAETLRGLSADFHLCHTHGTFYYQRRDGAPTRPSAAREEGTEETAPMVPLVVDADDSWVEAIRRASERIEALASGPVRPTVARSAGRGWDLAGPLELLGHERFTEALALLRALPPESAADPDVLLLHAVLLTHGGHLAQAEEVCHRLLALDELNAGAHYVRALCREGTGDRRGAVDHDQVAIYLDPGFAMPHLHLGLLARRAGDVDAARRELGQALALLQREDASRLLLFGGGFGREALLALCRAELVASGGADGR